MTPLDCFTCCSYFLTYIGKPKNFHKGLTHMMLHFHDWGNRPRLPPLISSSDCKLYPLCISSNIDCLTLFDCFLRVSANSKGDMFLEIFKYRDKMWEANSQAIISTMNITKMVCKMLKKTLTLFCSLIPWPTIHASKRHFMSRSFRLVSTVDKIIKVLHLCKCRKSKKWFSTTPSCIVQVIRNISEWFLSSVDSSNIRVR